MRDFKSTFRTDGANFPLTRAINDTAIGAKDGTEYVLEILDTLWGFAQASLSQNGATPNGSPETATNSQILTNILAMATAGIPKGFINGCLIFPHSSNLNRNIGFNTGICRSSDNLATIDFNASMVKSIDNNFVAGWGAGGRPNNITGAGTISVTIGSASITGVGTNFTTLFRIGDTVLTAGSQFGIITTITDDTNMTVSTTFSSTESGVAYAVHITIYNTTLHSFLLLNPTTGVVDAGFDHRTDGSVLLQDPNVIAGGFTKLRRVGSFITDTSSNIVQFTATETAGGGVDVGYTSNINEANHVSTTGAIQSLQLSVPMGVVLEAYIELVAYANATSSYPYVYAYDYSSSKSIKTGEAYSGSSKNDGYLMTNNNANIRYEWGGAGSRNLLLDTLGFRDGRTS